MNAKVMKERIIGLNISLRRGLKLQIKTHFFEVVEISEKELCLINDDKIIFDKKI